MKKIYVLEVNCEITSAYESKDAAMMAGLAKYIKFVSVYNNTHDTEFSSQQTIEDLRSLINNYYIEDYMYISEIPYFSAGDGEE